MTFGGEDSPVGREFLQTIRNPQYIADRLAAGESLITIASEYNNVTTTMIKKLIDERLPKPKATYGPKPREIDWDRVDALRELGYSYSKIAIALGVHRATLRRRAESREVTI